MSINSFRIGPTSWLIILGCFLLGAYSLYVGQEINRRYDQIAASQAQMAGPLEVYEFSAGNSLYITDYRQLLPARPLGLVSLDNPLPDDYRPSGLIASGLPHGDAAEDMMLQRRIDQPLRQLFSAAEASGHSLMISSAYRSIAQQRQVYQDYVARYGIAMAEKYVADVGTSEHHTGLSVDLSDASSSCAADSDSCGLSPSTATWLAVNAPNYGFILRYPLGKQAITHVGYEPWHYRYVGVVPARLLTDAGMTLDELHYELQPGIFK